MGEIEPLNQAGTALKTHVDSKSSTLCCSRGFVPVDRETLSDLLRSRDRYSYQAIKMIDDTDLGFFANFLGISIFVLLVAYHYVVAEPKYDSQF